MAVSISGTTIKMTRGDTLRILLTLQDESGNEYIPVEGDRIRFAMKRNYNDATPLLVKEIPNNTLELVLNPEDTKNLTQPSSYVYDIEMTYSNGDVDTFIDKAKLMLTEEVH
jgi:hypothetical protein